MDKNNSLVSVIIPTLNSELYLDKCLKSIKYQTYKNTEIIVVDNYSQDDTSKIARNYTKNFFVQGPERSSQRNSGAKKAKGKFLVFIDSDMELSKTVIEDCVQAMMKEDLVGVIIPEESFGQGFWAQCKKLERSFYIGVDWIEAARFFKKSIFNKSSGYDVDLISGEDWDLSQRIAKFGKIARIKSLLYHDEGKINFFKLVSKKYYYAKHFSKYIKKNNMTQSVSSQTNLVKRYWLYFSDPIKLFKNPLLGIGMLFLKTSEFFAGGIGLLLAH